MRAGPKSRSATCRTTSVAARWRASCPEDTDLVMVDTACSSSLYAIDLGVKGLHCGPPRHRRVRRLVRPRPARLGPVRQAATACPRAARLRRWTQDADGVLFADGAGGGGPQAPRRAPADGDACSASLAAFGSSSDGKGKAIYAPSAAGQGGGRPRLRRARGQPARDDWIVAHATGTPAGDLAEFTTLRETFPASGRSRSPRTSRSSGTPGGRRARCR